MHARPWPVVPQLDETTHRDTDSGHGRLPRAGGGVSAFAGQDLPGEVGESALLREPGLVKRIRSDPGARSLCIHCNKPRTGRGRL